MRSYLSQIHFCSKVENEHEMEMRRMTSKPENLCSEDEAWCAKKGSNFGEGFSVDDLLDLGDFGKADLESEDFEEQIEVGEHSNSSSSSLSLDPPPPPPASHEYIPIPAYDAADLEWVSLIIDDSLSDIPSSSSVAPPPPPPPRAPMTSPTEAPLPVRAKRSKRPRTSDAAAAAPWSISARLSLLSDSSSSCSSASSCLIFEPCHHAAGSQSCLLYGPPRPTKKQKPMKRGRKPKQPPSASARPVSSGERQCSHCGAAKTPQWRAGPLGAKTLCNACGVRFKSGRLLPEYRPACSPTFVSSKHSNSHRKILEMLRKKEPEFLGAAAPLPVPSF